MRTREKLRTGRNCLGPAQTCPMTTAASLYRNALSCHPAPSAIEWTQMPLPTYGIQHTWQRWKNQLSLKSESKALRLIDFYGFERSVDRWSFAFRMKGAQRLSLSNS